MKTYAIDTEYGIVHVDKSEFDDVKARVSGEYGPDDMKSPQGDPWVWIEETEHPDRNGDCLVVGRAQIIRPAQREEPKSAFECELRRLLANGETSAAFKHIDDWRKRGFDQ